MFNQSVVFFALWLTFFSQQAFAADVINITDQRGKTISFATPPVRVVSLLPSLTETICAIGACQSLVGVDNYSDYPPQVKNLPHIGDMFDVRIEQIVALHPDVVLAAESARLVPRLEELGVRVVVLEPRDNKSLRQSFATLEKLFAHPVDLWQQLQNALAAITLPPAAQKQRVYIEISDELYAASAGSFIGDLLTRLQLKNIVPAALGAFPRVSSEFVIAADPEIIVVAEHAVAALKQRPGWQRMSAVKNGNICALQRHESNLLMRPTPRLVEGMAWLQRCAQAAANRSLTIKPAPLFP